MEKLRDEIMQSESVRSDLLKWKLAIAGGIGGAGLGFAGSHDLRHADLVLCVIPLAAVYVDLLCRHLTLKMLVIGTFVARWKGGSDTAELFRAYEAFAARARRLNDRAEAKASSQSSTGWWRRLRDWLEVSFVGRRPGKPGSFDLEDWALSLSTVSLSVALCVYGIYLSARPSWFSAPFLASGVVGLVASAIGNKQYVRRFESVERLDPTDSERVPAKEPA